MKRILFILFLLPLQYLTGQELMNRDSLLRLLPAAKDDSNKVILYINLGQQYENQEPERAKYYYQSAGELSRQINYLPGRIRFAMNYTYVLNEQGLIDSSLLINLQSVQLARELGDNFMLAKTLFNTGSSYRLKEDYTRAVQYYEEGKRLFEPYKNEAVNAQVYDILQNLYTGMKQYRRSLEYGRLAVQGSGSLGNLTQLGTAYNNMGLNYTALYILDSAKYCFEQSLQIAQKIGNLNMEATQYLNLGDVYIQQNNYKAIRPLMEKALVIAKQLGLKESEVIARKGLSYHYFREGNFILAQQFADSALAIATRFDFRNERGKLYVHLSNLAYARQDLKSGEAYARLSEQLADSIMNETVQKTTLELEKKYELEKKEATISQLEAEKKVQQLTIRQKSTLNLVLIASAAALLVLFFLLYRNYRQKQELQNRKINELQQEKMLMATEAVLKGEEQERSRLAKDLHDGLGGMLSGIKFSFQTIKGNMVLTPDTQQAFERSMDMLDSSIKEMRRVAHNMMPEALVKFGLDTALRDFCEDINRTGALRVIYQSLGMEDLRVEQTAAIAVYRVVQELLNNTMKHAAAETAIVQLSRTDSGINITVEDDGKGFDPVILSQVKGIGWSNIQSRVEYLNGKMDVRSSPGNGTSVNIEFNL
jgi:two-component system, NarL family, sensor kinase